LFRGIALLLGLVVATAGHADEALWRQLQSGGFVVLIRHATAPGIGDPPGFVLGDCATQRNLSDAGRDEARRLGEAFRARGIPATAVLSSEWCRTRDTAQLAFGRYQAWPPLNSFMRSPDAERAQSQAVLERAARIRPGENLVLVTHQVNITALTGIGPTSAEMVIAKPGKTGALEVVGRLPPP
jgi:broad specificity phosphatase PhoE